MSMKTIVFLCLGVTLAASPALAACAVPASSLKIPSNQTALVAPTFPPSFVALGVGVQNYTCSNTSTYTNVGAVAELFDISCVVDSALSPYLTSAVEALWSAIPSDTFNTTELISTLGFLGNPDVIGQHYFVPNPATGSGSSPKFDFTSARFNGVAEAFVVLAKTGDVVSPDDKSVDVDWLYLTALSYGGQGDLAGSAFRVETAGGQPPASCNGADSISVKYAAKYYLYNTTLPASVLDS
ncbi:uncharacterized protein STEHIDRAFT_119880 [Stereum hirsutum FP-91666 SS1]|uniref:uncharacterized protein n=1 Tax=Stereum hirsutum (strain FP-91666) TaxID=721885 RepID=UPI000440B80E|nr:uncharacterized protein STEHIDRAFT_119880 [Stereum hirsutum FP-91666 SS1]EIM89136.1 hypothetical protein STEHIDRAFT_119880 [Stereum hirsutum FP-91666 SS1]